MTDKLETLQTEHKRDVSLDVIRIFAFLCIPFAHFFLNTGFYSQNMDNVLYIIIMCLRNLSLTCIPLFMMLTGYLQGTKDIKPDKKYYLKSAKFIIPYLITSLLILILNGFIQKRVPSVIDVLKGFTTFTGYSWYVEMYLGIFILIPFLNMLYKGIKTKKQEKLLIFALIFFTLLPSVVNTFSFNTENWLFGPSDTYVKIIPDFWKKLYPVTFYYTGIYIRKHKDEMNLKPFRQFLWVLGTFAVTSFYCIIRNIGRTPTVYSWINRSSFIIYLPAVAIFCFLLSVDYSKISNGFTRFLGKISDLTFSAYLCSYIVDTLAYRILPRFASTFREKLLTFPIVFPAVVICSLIAALAVDAITTGSCKFINRIFLKNP